MKLHLIRNYFEPVRILDIGANKGQFYKLAKGEFPDSYIFSIEAFEECEAELAKVNSNYKIALLADENKMYDFYVTTVPTYGTGNSIYRELTHWYDDKNIKVVQKEGICLDTLFDETEYFDLIKIDTQGSELDIMRGGPSVCAHAKGILLEVSVERYNENSPLLDEVDEYMDSIGYVSVEILDESNHPITKKLIQKDILYIKK